MAWHFSLSGVTFFSQWRDTFLKSKLKVYATNENNLVTSYNIRTSLWDVCVNSLSDFLMNHEYHRYFKDLTFLPRHLTAFGSLYKWQSCVSLQKSDCLLIRENHRYFDDLRFNDLGRSHSKFKYDRNFTEIGLPTDSWES